MSGESELRQSNHGAALSVGTRLANLLNCMSPNNRFQATAPLRGAAPEPGRWTSQAGVCGCCDL